MVNPERPLKIHMVHQSFGDYVGGLGSGYDELIDAGEVELLTTTIVSGSNGPGGAETTAGDHRRVELPRFRDPRSFPKAYAAVRRIVSQECDVLHWQAAGNPWVDLAFLMQMDGNKTALTIHDMQAHPGDKNVLPGTFAVIARLARKARLVIVHASHVKAQVEAASVASERISVFAHGELATRYVDEDKLPLRTTDTNTVLFFGRIQGYKGLDVAVEAVRQLNSQIDKNEGSEASPVTLIVAGRGPSLAEVFPDKISVPSWVEIQDGYVSSSEVVSLFERSSVVVLPYREASQSGVAALAAGFGKPVVASDVPGLDEMIEDGNTGVLVEPGDSIALSEALSELLTNESARATLSRGAIEAARGRLSWPSIANQHHELFLSISEY